MKSLKQKGDIVILPADKGNVTVVLDKIQYEEKMRTLLGNPVYRKINKNPTGYIERKTSIVKLALGGLALLRM